MLKAFLIFLYLFRANLAQVRGLNRNAHAFLVGTKYDLYTSMPVEEQRDIDKQVLRSVHGQLLRMISMSP